jgi:PEGA domain-containing protein
MRKKWHPMRLAGLPFLALIASFTTAGLPSAARAAEGGDVATVVLGIEPLDGAPDAVAAEITDALRQRVAATKGYQLLQGKDLVEVKLVFACPDAAPACMSAAGKSLGADKLIFGNVKRAGNDYQVTLKLLDVSRAVVESFTAETVARKHADANGLRSIAPAWLAKLSGKGGGSIQVRANFPGAAVSLDGTQVGTTGGSPVVINDVAPGRHEVAVEKSGYTTTKQEFTLAAGQSLPLNLTLSPVSVEVPRPEGAGKGSDLGANEPSGGEEGPSMTRIGFWVAMVGTVLSAGAALKFGLDVRDVNAQLDQYRRLPCPGNPSEECDVNNNTLPPITPQERQEQLGKAKTLTDEGNKDQLLQWVFVGLTGAFAIAGGVLLYKGYLATEGTQSASNHGLRLFPAATASSGGIIAEFEF